MLNGAILCRRMRWTLVIGLGIGLLLILGGSAVAIRHSAVAPETKTRTGSSFFASYDPQPALKDIGQVCTSTNNVARDVNYQFLRFRLKTTFTRTINIDLRLEPSRVPEALAALKLHASNTLKARPNIRLKECGDADDGTFSCDYEDPDATGTLWIDSIDQEQAKERLCNSGGATYRVAIQLDETLRN